MTAPTRRGVHDRLAGLGPPGPPPQFATRRTLRLRVELVRQLRRRRTQLAFLILLVLPILIAIAFKVGGQRGGGGSALVDLATTGAGNFAMFTEFAAVGFLLVVIVALFCGDTVASEASWSSLRYLLAMPVPRGRLLRQKLIVALILSLGANVFLPAWSYLVGGRRRVRRSAARSAPPRRRGGSRSSSGTPAGRRWSWPLWRFCCRC
jgi:ABC-2 type transport system permease protein